MKYVIEPNVSKQAACDTAERVCQVLRSFSAQIIMARPMQTLFGHVPGIRFVPEDDLLAEADFLLAIGGDGTILRSARRILRDAALYRHEPVKLAGINTGTLGFLAAFEADEPEMLARLESGDYTLSQRMMLSVNLGDECKNDPEQTALNDIYASRMNGRICDFNVSVDGRQIGVFRADGIIFSTPTGSSAYALSAGGPIMEPNLLVIEMNLICPHSLFARPILFAPTREIRVTYRGVGDGGLRLHTDGVETAVLHNQDSFTVRRSPFRIPFVSCKGQTFYDVLNGKLMRPLKDDSLPL